MKKPAGRQIVTIQVAGSSCSSRTLVLQANSSPDLQNGTWPTLFTNESVAEPSPSVTAMIGNGDTVTCAADRFNGAASVRNDREGRLAKTRPSVTAARRKKMSRLMRVRPRAREGARPGGAER